MAYKKILIISLGNVANTIYTLPMVNVLKGYNYSVEYVVCEKGFSIVNKNSKVDKIFLASMEQWTGKWLNPDTWEAFFKLIERIKLRDYDIVLDCQQDIRSLLIFAMCNGKRKITYSDAKGFSSIGSNEVVNAKNQTENIVERNLNLIKYLGLDYTDIEFPLPETDYTYVLKYDKLFDSLDKTKQTIIIAAGAKNESKRWSAANWTALIAQLKNDYNLIFTGGIPDKFFIKEIGGEAFINLCGETRIESFIDVVRRADIVISSDTEAAAIAWATQKPKVITLFTCTSPEKYAPFDPNNKEKYISLYGKLPCQPCHSGICLDDEPKCRKFPTVDDVMRAIKNN